MNGPCADAAVKLLDKQTWDPGNAQNIGSKHGAKARAGLSSDGGRIP